MQADLGKQSALLLKLRLRPLLSAAQVSCSLADLEVALLKALPAISKEINVPKPLGSRRAPLLEGEHLTWRSQRSIGTDGAGFSDTELQLYCNAAQSWHPAVPGPSTQSHKVCVWGL